MKRHLFYTFLAMFGITSIVTLLGVLGIIKIPDGYLWALVSAFLIESAGAVVAIFKRADFFSEADAAPFKVSDDFEFDTDGYWIERKTGLRVCAKCLLPPTKIVSPLAAVGTGFEETFQMVWRCGHCGTDYFYKT